MPNIKVGLIRCDLHAVYYAALMAEHDPLVLRDPPPIEGPPRYSWQTGGGHFYHYTHYADAKRMTVEFVGGFDLVKCWDQDPRIARQFTSIWTHTPEVCESFEQVSDGVDLVFIADCNGDGNDHLELATPGLKKRVPTFIDKPFALHAADAKKILQTAHEHDTPVLSLSILRSVPNATQFRNRLPEVGDLQYGGVYGGGSHMAGLIHSISLAQHVFGPGVRTVRALGGTDEDRLGAIHLDFGGRTDRPKNGVLINCDVGTTYHCSFHVTALGTEGMISSFQINDWTFPFGAAINVKKVKQMLETGRCPVPEDEMLEPVAVADAARQSKQSGRAAAVAEFL